MLALSLRSPLRAVSTIMGRRGSAGRKRRISDAIPFMQTQIQHQQVVPDFALQGLDGLFRVVKNIHGKMMFPEFDGQKSGQIGVILDDENAPPGKAIEDPGSFSGLELAIARRRELAGIAIEGEESASQRPNFHDHPQ